MEEKCTRMPTVVSLLFQSVSNMLSLQCNGTDMTLSLTSNPGHDNKRTYLKSEDAWRDAIYSKGYHAVVWNCFIHSDLVWQSQCTAFEAKLPRACAL